MYSSHRPASTVTSNRHDAPNSISVPFVLLASVLMGIGLMLIFTWLITFDWLFFPGVLVVAIGAFMMLSPRMGSDHA
ncbi:MAG TPA: hypothetical protein VGP88_06260 [Thermoplasmata archaeon]|jgi:hypothetical protein|nr:hypothetical protein [Thermoplasmata archaeon]